MERSHLNYPLRHACRVQCIIYRTVALCDFTHFRSNHFWVGFILRAFFSDTHKSRYVDPYPRYSVYYGACFLEVERRRMVNRHCPSIKDSDQSS